MIQTPTSFRYGPAPELGFTAAGGESQNLPAMGMGSVSVSSPTGPLKNYLSEGRFGSGINRSLRLQRYYLTKERRDGGVDEWMREGEG